MGGMKTKNVHEFLIPSVCLLLVLSFWSNAPNALVSAQTFLLSDGDNVTCYPIQDQRSLNGASYNRYPTTVITPGNSTSDSAGSVLAQQTMAEEAGACPEGTIPIRAPRGTLNESIDPLFPRMSNQFPLLSSQKTVAPIVKTVQKAPHEYGIASLGIAGTPSFKGTEVFINVWEPLVEGSGEFSLAQLWVISGNNTIEAGYQVYEDLYGDGLPRLFVYWTADLYKTTGCYDLGCPGFVQVSNKVLLAGSFSTISSQGGQQYEIKYQVFKDDGTGDWWLQLNDEYVGYWPNGIYDVETPFDYANNIQWGGEIVDNEPADGNEHTTTEMGSGQFAEEGYGKAAYQRNLQYIDINNNLVDAPFFVYASESKCYTAQIGTDYPDWGSFFFYGGDGLSSSCLHDPVYEAPPPPS